MNERKVQIFFRMVTKISEALGGGDEVFYAVEREESEALEMAKELIEEYLAENRAQITSNPQTEIPVEKLIEKYSAEKGGSAVNGPCTWNEVRSKSGNREWTSADGDNGIQSMDIFQCGGKKGFKSFKDAEIAAANYSKLRKERFVAYKCTYCDNYHFGGDR